MPDARPADLYLRFFSWIGAAAPSTSATSGFTAAPPGAPDAVPRPRSPASGPGGRPPRTRQGRPESGHVRYGIALP
jgi:hypothetical protein